MKESIVLLPVMKPASKSQLYRLAHQHETLNEMILDLNDDELWKRPNPEKWSIAENMAHLGRYQEIFIDRLLRIISGERPEFGRYKAEHDPDFNPWLEKPADQVLNQVFQKRKNIVDTIRSLSEQQLTEQGKHPKLGWMDVNAWIEFFLLHEAHHLYTIFWLRSELKR